MIDGIVPAPSRIGSDMIKGLQRKIHRMDREEFALEVIEKARFCNPGFGFGFGIQRQKFSPVLDIDIYETSFINKRMSVRIRIRNIHVELRFSHDDFSNVYMYDSIPQRLPGGLKRLHKKGKLIPLLQAHMLL